MVASQRVVLCVRIWGENGFSPTTQMIPRPGSGGWGILNLRPPTEIGLVDQRTQTAPARTDARCRFDVFAHALLTGSRRCASSRHAPRRVRGERSVVATHRCPRRPAGARRRLGRRVPPAPDRVGRSGRDARRRHLLRALRFPRDLSAPAALEIWGWAPKRLGRTARVLVWSASSVLRLRSSSSWWRGFCFGP